MLNRAAQLVCVLGLALSACDSDRGKELFDPGGHVDVAAADIRADIDPVDIGEQGDTTVDAGPVEDLSTTPVDEPTCFGGRTIGEGLSNIELRGLAFTPSGDIVVGVLFAGTIDIGLGELTASVGWDVLVAVFSPELEPMRQIHLTGESFVEADVAVNANRIFVAGAVGDPPTVFVRSYDLDGEERFATVLDLRAGDRVNGVLGYGPWAHHARYVHVATGRRGDVAVGLSDASDRSVGVVVLGPDGDELWRANSNTAVQGIAVDDQGRVFSASEAWSAAGEQRWTAPANVGGGPGKFNVLLAAESGRLAQAGIWTTTNPLGEDPSLARSALTIVSSDAESGAVQWHRTFPQRILESSLSAVAGGVAASGTTVVVTGIHQNDNTDWGFDVPPSGDGSPFLLAFGPAGAPLWMVQPTATGLSVGQDVAIARDGRVVFGGELGAGEALGGGIFPDLTGPSLFIYASCP